MYALGFSIFCVPCSWFYSGNARLSLLWGSGCKVRLPNLGAYDLCAVPCPPPSHHLLIRLFPLVRTWRFLFYNFLTGLSRLLTLFFLFPCFSLAHAGQFSSPSQAYTLPKCPLRVRATPTTTTRAKLGSRFPPPHAKAFFLGACSDSVHHHALAV